MTLHYITLHYITLYCIALQTRERLRDTRRMLETTTQMIRHLDHPATLLGVEMQARRHRVPFRTPVLRLTLKPRDPERRSVVAFHLIATQISRPRREPWSCGGWRCDRRGRPA